MIEAARLEKQAAEDAVDAARLAKQEVVKDRASLDQERTQLAAAREEVEQRAAVAGALLAKAEAKRTAAESARTEAAKEQIVLAEQIAVLEATKEAATISELAAEQARSLSAVERKAAERAKATADSARQEAAFSYEYVRSVLQQLRDAQTNVGTLPVGATVTSIEIGAKVAENSTTVE